MFVFNEMFVAITICIPVETITAPILCIGTSSEAAELWQQIPCKNKSAMKEFEQFSQAHKPAFLQPGEG